MGKMGKKNGIIIFIPNSTSVYNYTILNKRNLPTAVTSTFQIS